METQSYPFPSQSRQPGCPRRILTDRTYLKDTGPVCNKPADLRLRQKGEIWSETLLKKDTIITETSRVQ